jgi:hypothetical protein
MLCLVPKEPGRDLPFIVIYFHVFHVQVLHSSRTQKTVKLLVPMVPFIPGQKISSKRGINEDGFVSMRVGSHIIQKMPNELQELTLVPFVPPFRK